MIIPINLPTRCAQANVNFPPQLAKLGTEEVILLELQGSFHVEGDQTGQVAAELNLDIETKPTLLIGHNLLEGKIVNLSKPLAVLYKKNANGDDMEVDGEQKVEEREGACEYDMVSVVKRKVLFSKRPMPMVNLASAPVDLGAKK